MSATPWLKLLRNPRLLLLLFTLLSVISSAQTQMPLFPTTSFFDAGAQVVTATGDFNGDGQVDLVTLTPNQGASIVTALLNQGDTTPPLAVTTAINLNPVRLVAVDMNNDKKLDLVTNAVSGGSAGIAVLFGNGDGTFQSPVFYPIVAPGNIVAVDLNGDGYPDLAFITAPTLTALRVAVLLNQGSSAPGTLSAPTSYALSITFAQTGPLNIGAADFNGDGKRDILVGGTNLAVFYGAGDGTLQLQQSPVVPTGLSGGAYFVASDLNHDGISDVAYIATSTSTLSLQVLLGHSNGTFTVGSNLPLGLSNAYPIALVSAGTTNGGTNINLAAVSDKTSIVLGDGNGNFSQGPSYAINGTPFPVLNSSGKTDLVFELISNLVSSADNQITRLTANGDGTFQGVPTLPVGPFGFAAADLNGDGLTDVLSVDSQNHLITGLGRGNGTFTVTNSVSGAPAKLLVTADFNADGNPDAAIITPGDGSSYPFSPVVDSTLVLYKGNGDGSFQLSAAPVDLQVVGAIGAITGDFNVDGTVDVVVAYSNAYLDPTTSQGLVFLAGKGDGTFATAAPLAPESFTTVTPLLLAADLNNDHKLDLLWNGSIYLGNGDGTFHKSTVPLPGPVLAVGDLNGDGVPDVVIGTSVYAGNGDGTFHASPLYTATLPSNAKFTLATISDSNVDGKPDLLFQYQLTGLYLNSYQAANTYLTVFLGDGKGNFTVDSNNYYAGNFNDVLGLPGFSPVAFMAVPARLNNQAPKGIAQDYLTWTNDGATALLNQTSPRPTAPSPLPSKTSLTASLSNAVAGQQVTFTATVSGVIPAAAPSGTVTFTSGGTTLGASSIVNGVASVTASFPTSSTYPVTASYVGDSNNAPSSSAAVSVTIARVASTIALNASTPTTGINQSLTFSSSISGLNPTGTVTFSFTGGSTLGTATATITQGVATFAQAFSTAGTYSVTASYSGDVTNLPSTSNTITVTVVAPDYTITASPTSATVTAGQSATAALNALSQNGYHGTLNLSCTGVTAGENCTFSPATLTLQAGGSAVSSTIAISTTAPTSAQLRGIVGPLQGIAWASLLCLTLSPRRIWRLNRRLLRTSLLTLLLALSLIQLSGCGGSSSPSTPQNAGTPKGTQTITVTAADSAGGPSHSIALQLTVQ